MYSTDPIADMLTRIRNALARQHKQVIIPYTQIKEQVIKIFMEYQFIASFKLEGSGKNKQIIVELTNERLPISPITKLQRCSRPGRRLYVGWREIPRIKSGRGFVILSTNKGLMTSMTAKRANLGGEVICSIY